MALQRFKVALNAARFPLVSTKGNRAVFIPGLDSAPRTPRQYVGAEPNVDYNTPQVLYMQDVMPVGEGLRSVGYTQKIQATVNDDFDTIFPLRDADENIALYSPAKGKNYVYDQGLSLWKTKSLEDIQGLTLAAGYDVTKSKVTYAYVDGKTLICYSRLKSNTNLDMSLILWDSSTLGLLYGGSIVQNLPFPAGEIDGISSSSGYLLVWSGLSVAWAPFNGTAFNFINYANGAFTGAGNQIPEDVQGKILAIVGVSGGFMMFTNRNCVAASYHAQNLQAPWVFREVPGAGGASSYEEMTVEGSLGAVYAYTTAGLQRVTVNSAEPVQPQVADFITSRQIERYYGVTKTLVQSASGQDLATKITNIGNRYLAISYGLVKNQYEYVLIYDLMLERFGKLAFRHTDCFHYTFTPTATSLTYDQAGSMTYDDFATTTYDSGEQDPTTSLTPAQHAIGLLTNLGAVFVAEWSDLASASLNNGVAIIGRIQLTRARNAQINRIEVEGLESGSVGVCPSYDGGPVSDYIALEKVVDVPGLTIVGGIVDAKNFNLVIEGTFDLSTVIVEAQPSGQI